MNCLHGCIFPKFDTNKLYKSRTGHLTRKKLYEYYYPNKLYETSRGQLNFYTINKINIEFDRISMITKELLKKHLLLNSLNNKKKINILDWGGGDGYIAHLIKIILESTYNLNINVDVFDLSKWSKITKQRILIKKYDFILLSHVLEHVHDLQKLIVNIKGYMNKNSSIIVEVPDERISILKSNYITKKNLFKLSC